MGRAFRAKRDTAYAEALEKLSEATAVLRWAQYGPELLDALEKTQQARTKHDSARRTLEDHRKARSSCGTLGRFATGRDKTRPRNEWCRDSLYERAKEAGLEYLDLYRMFYRQASSMYHLDFGGVVAQSDANMLADMAPSWACLDDALVATGCTLRAINLYDEIANLGFKERIENGPMADYVTACQSLQ
jgi:hypothetical protein